MECNFTVGQKVILVDDEWPNRTYSGQITRPVKGGIYTIREIRLSLVPERGGVRPCLLLGEIVNEKVFVKFPSGMGMGEPTFDCSRFRAVKNLKTDISIFNEMLSPSKEQVSA